MRPMAHLAPLALAALALPVAAKAASILAGSVERSPENLLQQQTDIVLNWWLSLYPLEQQGIDVVAVPRPVLPPLPKLPTVDEINPNEANPAFLSAGASRDRSGFEKSPLRDQKIRQRTESAFGTVHSQVTFSNPQKSWDTPLTGDWKREDTLFVPVAGPLHVFGQVGAASAYDYDNQMKVVTQSGVAVQHRFEGG